MAEKYVPRILNLADRMSEKSHFLLGPRQTGKSTLIRKTLPDALIFDLNASTDLLNLTRNPSFLEESIGPDDQVVVIDEIQKAVSLLNEVHRIIESKNVRFLLTGSSARKLRQKGVNLLGGRARMLRLHPLLFHEIGEQFDLTRALRFGTLPSIYLSERPREELSDYVGLYLREEVLAEGLTRNLQSFSRVLDIAALCNATIVNFDKVSKDVQVPRSTVREYFQVLKDTLILEEIPAWREGQARKPALKSKYYFFDTGIVAMLLGRTGIQSRTPEYGFAFETWLFHELHSWVDYSGVDAQISHWRTQAGIEVDFLLGDQVAVEAKAKQRVTNHDLKGLTAIGEEHEFQHRICVCLEDRPRYRNGITILPYQVFLENLWRGEYLE